MIHESNDESDSLISGLRIAKKHRESLQWNEKSPSCVRSRIRKGKRQDSLIVRSHFLLLYLDDREIKRDKEKHVFVNGGNLDESLTA